MVGIYIIQNKKAVECAVFNQLLNLWKKYYQKILD